MSSLPSEWSEWYTDTIPYGSVMLASDWSAWAEAKVALPSGDRFSDWSAWVETTVVAPDRLAARRTSFGWTILNGPGFRLDSVTGWVPLGGSLVDESTAMPSFWSAWSTATTFGAEPATDMIVVLAASEGGTGQNAWTAFVALDDALASAASTTRPFSAGRHTYSGNTFPSLFSNTNANADYTAGYSHSVLNVKCPWDQLANGTLDQHINDFIDSIPTGHTLYLIINHEPENDGNPLGASVWRAGQARAANIIASRNDPRCHFAFCLMTYTWDPGSGRNPSDWNPAREGTMTSAAMARTIFAPDGYTKVRNSSGTSWDTMDSEFASSFSSAASWGFTRFAISEHALNNDIGAPATAIANIWNTSLFPWIDAAGLVYYAGYSDQGPAAGTNARIDTPEEIAAFSAWIAGHKGADGW